jgi:hypothetical protein
MKIKMKMKEKEKMKEKKKEEKKEEKKEASSSLVVWREQSRCMSFRFPYVNVLYRVIIGSPNRG